MPSEAVEVLAEGQGLDRARAALEVAYRHVSVGCVCLGGDDAGVLWSVNIWTAGAGGVLGRTCKTSKGVVQGESRAADRWDGLAIAGWRTSKLVGFSMGCDAWWWPGRGWFWDGNRASGGELHVCTS